MLQVADLVCGYGDITAVHGISLTLGQGETMALVGPNGAGNGACRAYSAAIWRDHAGW
jgi:ABC-type branched-subunit amino acid transport system ATPase component